MKEVGKIYSSVDADELETGDIVVVDYNLSAVKKITNIRELEQVCEEKYPCRFQVIVDGVSVNYSLAKLICPKKHAEVFWAWKNGAKIQYRINNEYPWSFVTDIPTWDEECEYRVAEDPYEKRRMTNRELAKWLAQGNGLAMLHRDVVSSHYSYIMYEEDKECSEYIQIRAWDEEEWHEPLVEVDE